MAKDRNRGNREPKKPKAGKKPVAPPASPFTKAPANSQPAKQGGK